MTLSFGLLANADEPDEPAEPEVEAKKFRHVVLFKFKDEVTKDQVTMIEKAFAELPNKIKTIIDFEWGTDVSQEGLSQDFTHCFVVTFKDQAGLDVYLPHEDHQAFVAMLKPSLDKVLVVDYVTR